MRKYSASLISPVDVTLEWRNGATGREQLAGLEKFGDTVRKKSGSLDILLIRADNRKDFKEALRFILENLIVVSPPEDVSRLLSVWVVSDRTEPVLLHLEKSDMEKISALGCELEFAVYYGSRGSGK